MIVRRLILLFFLLITFFLDFPGWEVPGATGASSYRRTIEQYNIPDVTLINQEGKKIHLTKILSADKPVLVNFVYTTCTTICPVLSANFVNFQRRKGPEGKTQLVSISIDPENDTPRNMKAYLKRYGAKEGWDFLTGSREDMDKVIRAFNALNGTVLNKMDHLPIILIKAPAENRWVRIYGLIGTTELMKEYAEVDK